MNKKEKDKENMERIIINAEESDMICFHISSASDYFDIVIGHIEDIVVEDEFQSLQRNFFETNCQKFDDSDENKLEYMDIFKEYTNTIETYIMDQLKNRMGNFDMDEFAKELHERKSLLDGEIFDLLASFSDFESFKEMIIDFKADKEGKYNDINLGITVTKIPDEELTDSE